MKEINKELKEAFTLWINDETRDLELTINDEWETIDICGNSWRYYVIYSPNEFTFKLMVQVYNDLSKQWDNINNDNILVYQFKYLKSELNKLLFEFIINDEQCYYRRQYHHIAESFNKWQLTSTT